MRYFLPNDYPLLLSAAGDGRWQRGPSRWRQPGLSQWPQGGVVKVARLLPTLTWHPEGLMQPWPGPTPHGPRSTTHRASSGACTHLVLVLPQPTKAPRLGRRRQEGPREPSGADSPLCITVGYFPQQKKLMMVLQDWGEGGKAFARVACFEFMEVLRVSSDLSIPHGALVRVMSAKCNEQLALRDSLGRVRKVSRCEVFMGATRLFTQ